MTTDKVAEALLEALRQGLAQPGEQRLFRSGKLAGLFPSRLGANSEAAARGLREGLLEVVRTETRGKTAVEWVKITPRGVNHLHEQESPVRVLRDLRAALQTTRDGVPAWLAQVRQDLDALAGRMAGEVEAIRCRLDALGQRVDETLRRAEEAGPRLPEGLTAAVPWALEALAYLDRRAGSGAAGDCPLPELFAAVRERHADLALPAFHDGLRRLHDRRALRLVAHVEPGPMPEPEYALPDGAAVYYYAAR